MPRITIDFNDELHKFIKSLIKQKEVSSFQEITMKGLILYLKQNGIEEIEKLSQYQLKESYTRSYTRKVQNENKNQKDYTRSYTNQLKTLTDREQMRQSSDERYQEEHDPDENNEEMPKIPTRRRINESKTER
jgi:hypothetical protein